ncbi:MAG TPA: hypothetical protein VGK27_04065 [Candidatus Deferrimicrobiaceae bacterium]|jgi:hypothetical protein
MDQYCNPVDKADYGRNIQDILDVFRKIHAGEIENDLSLLNYYKGIPINYPASVLGIDHEFVEFETHAYQAVAIDCDKSTFIKSGHFRHEILAEAFYVRVPEREVSLKNFLYTKVLAENRNFVRVALQEKREIEVDYAGRLIRGNLVDICLKSAAIDLPRDCPVRPGTISRLRLTLPMGPDTPDLALDVLASASKSWPEGDLSRCVFDLQGDSVGEGRIARFIGHRQTEIVAEIREAFWAMEAKAGSRTDDQDEKP